jgi:hypothetical protein
VRTAARRVAIAVAVMGLLAGCGSRTIQGAGQPAPVITGSGDTAAPTTAAPSPSPPPVPTPTPTPTPMPSPTPTVPGARPCPDAVARALPGAGPAELVAGYETARFRLYYCRTADGTLYYRGVSRSDPNGVLTLPAHPIPGGYEATRFAAGSVFVYQVVDRVLRVSRDGRVLRVDPVLRDL